MKTNKINFVDICCGLNWGDEAKGKVVSYLSKSGVYDFVCRWNGGNNAGHTVYVNGKKFKTHLIPCGIFYGIKCIIGPDCVIHQDGFLDEINYLKENNFNIDLIKVSPKAHIISDKHIEEDKLKYGHQGTTSRGIAPCYRDKYGRTGVQAKDVDFFKDYLWDEELYGNILCEGAQGFWLDINHGNYPYTTSSVTLPYSACSLGFPPQKIRNIYGCTKIYDTRSGIDPLFPEELLEDKELKIIIENGKEFGTTTNRMRKVNWLNINKLLKAIEISGANEIIISKTDVLNCVNIFKLIINDEIISFECVKEMKEFINNSIYKNEKNDVKKIIYSDDLENICDLVVSDE